MNGSTNSHSGQKKKKKKKEKKKKKAREERGTQKCADMSSLPTRYFVARKVGAESRGGEKGRRRGKGKEGTLGAGLLTREKKGEKRRKGKGK